MCLFAPKKKLMCAACGKQIDPEKEQYKQTYGLYWVPKYFHLPFCPEGELDEEALERVARSARIVH